MFAVEMASEPLSAYKPSKRGGDRDTIFPKHNLSGCHVDVLHAEVSNLTERKSGHDE
jgi:hypothetical protein